jgi:phosphate transport system protein
VKEHFAEQLEELRRNLILMGGEVERQIQRSIEALTEIDPSKARAVIADDEGIDRMEVAIEEQAVSLLALQQPVAVDLRFLVAALKINNDLERIGDHAVNIAEGAERLAETQPMKPFVDLQYMSEVAMSMLKDSLDAFVNRDADLARKVIRRDDILDDKNVSIIRELLT